MVVLLLFVGWQFARHVRKNDLVTGIVPGRINSQNGNFAVTSMRDIMFNERKFMFVYIQFICSELGKCVFSYGLMK